MRKIILIFTVLFFISYAQASIVDWSCDDDGDGAIVMNDVELTPNGYPSSYDLIVDCTQFWGPGHIDGYFDTDTEEDPTVYLIQSVENASSFDWTDYHIDIGMTSNFTIDSVVAPGDWTWVISQPVAGEIPNGCGPGWVGSVDFYAGTPINIGEEGTFGVVFSFLGDVQFCTEQFPTPEPATMAFFALGAIAILRRR